MIPLSNNIKVSKASKPNIVSQQIGQMWTTPVITLNQGTKTNREHGHHQNLKKVFLLTLFPIMANSRDPGLGLGCCARVRDLPACLWHLVKAGNTLINGAAL